MNKPVFEATRAQNASAHPARSTFVSANAGSGKTTILTRRMARLLLAGVEPQSILCLTFTKAASGEVQERIFKLLGEWVLLPNPDLRTELASIGETDLSDDELSKTRQLFAKALETPSGLKVQTIHAFCAGLLRRFPLEAKISPSFQEMDDAQAQIIAYQAMQNVIEDDPELARRIAQFRTLSPDLSEQIVDMRNIWQSHWSAQNFAQHIINTAEINMINEAQFWQNIDDFANIDSQEILLEQLKTRHKGKEYITLRRQGELHLDLLKTVIFSGNKLKAKIPAPETKYAGADQSLLFAQHLVENFNALHAHEYFSALQELHQFGDRVFSRYQALKSKNFFLDYDDLIECADKLLSQNNRMNWVMYRMDSRISHILVDEAQDTNEAQWRIIDAIASAGLEDETHMRTLFVVGDEKQSIFSFQGANPAVFQDRREYYKNALKARAETLQEEDLLVSFRSSPLILDFVDEVFKSPLQSGLGEKIKHEARAETIPGSIEILPFNFKERPQKQFIWPKIGVDPSERAEQELAENIAEKIREEIASGKSIITKEGERPIRAGDYLILVRKRDSFFYAVQKALVEAEVPIAGVDKLNLNQELCIKDVMALLRAVATPFDDLSLACFLRSPLGGLSEQELYTLAAHREKQTLLEALKSSHHHQAVEIFSDIQSQTDYKRPHDLILRILQHHNGEAKLRSRLGVAASDALHALLDKALEYEICNTPSLIGFIHWFDAYEIDLKRVLSETENAVRVMTIHGAKGLEANAVILALNESRSPNDGFLMSYKNIAITRGSQPQPPFEIQDILNAQKSKDAEEDNRLLYVALTRACARLIICGAGVLTKELQKNGFPDDHPYSILSRAIETLNYETGISEDGTIWARHNWPDHFHKTEKKNPPTNKKLDFPALPKSSQIPNIGLSSVLPELTPKGGRGKEYGLLFHELMEHLIHWPLHERENFAHARFAENPELDEALKEALNILNEYDDIFQKPALEELSFELPIEDKNIIGRLDHVALGEEIYIIDYKTDLDIATHWQELHPRYQMQLSVYAEAMKQLIKDKPIRSMILWSKTGQKTEASGEQLDKAYQQFLISQKNTPE